MTSTFELDTDYEIAATPHTEPYQCVCGKGMPADGEFLRLGQFRFGVGYLWLCGGCQEIVLKAHRLMSLKLYEERTAHDAAILAEKAAGLEAERTRLRDIEEREAVAVAQAADAATRAERAETEVAQLRQTVADLERSTRELSVRAQAAESGSLSIGLWRTHRERLEAIVAEHAGPARRSASAKR